MKLFFKGKDGGEDSNVTGYWLIEWKQLFSIVLLKFDRGSREAHHSHAFNSVSWILKGQLMECVINPYSWFVKLKPSFVPIFTSRDRFHKVHGIAKTTWVVSFRGPWAKTWKEYLPERGEITLTNGRKELNGRQ